jgi:hypothetical protein
MLFRETAAVYCGEPHGTHRMRGFWYVKEGGTYSDQWDLKG